MILESLQKISSTIKNKKAQFYIYYAQALYQGEDSEARKSIEQLKRQSNLTYGELLIFERLLHKWKYEKQAYEVKSRYIQVKIIDDKITDKKLSSIEDIVVKIYDEVKKSRKGFWITIIVNSLLFVGNLVGNILANMIYDIMWVHWLTITLFVIIGIGSPLIIELFRRKGWI